MFKKILSFITSRVLFFILGIAVVAGAGFVSAAVYSNWNAAKTTANPGNLAESNWNTLVTGLADMDTRLEAIKTKVDSMSASGGPGTCAVRTNSSTQWATASCLVGEILISGGCAISGTTLGNLTANRPVLSSGLSAWYCASSCTTCNTQATAVCCK